MGAAPKIKMTNVTRRMIITIAKVVAKEVIETATATTTSVVHVMTTTMIAIDEAQEVEEGEEEAVVATETIDTEMIVAAGVDADLGPWLDEPSIVFQETEMMADLMIDEGTGLTTMTQGVVEEEAGEVAAMVGGLKEVVVEGT